jgi:hypothetical protein
MDSGKVSNMTDSQEASEVPSPLGWCSDCLLKEKWTRAVTLFAGASVCHECLKQRLDLVTPSMR